MSVCIARPSPATAGAELTDAVVVRRMQAEDQSDFPVIYNRYHHRLFGMFYAILHQKSEAEELEQRTWYGFLVGIQGFDPTRDLWCWLRAIATRVLGRYREKDLRRGHVPLPGGDQLLPVPLTCDGPDSDCRRHLVAAEVESALEGLPARQRDTIERNVVEGVRLVDLARLWHVRPSTVRSWRTRAARRMRLQLRCNVLGGYR